jgi:hypothetical protein
MRFTRIKNLTIKCCCRYLSKMEVLALLCLALVAGHVLSVFAIMSGMKSVMREMKGIVLEREETHRTIYAKGPDTSTDTYAQGLYAMED